MKHSLCNWPAVGRDCPEVAHDRPLAWRFLAGTLELRVRWMLLVAVPGLAVSDLACGGQAPSEETPKYRGAPFVCGEPGSDTLAKSLSPDGTVDKTSPILGLEIGQLATLPGRTTPDAVCVRLQSDLDYVLVQARIKGPGYTSSCQLTELYRIGPAAQPWEVWDIHRFPLEYSEVLPPGLYAQEVKVWEMARRFARGPAGPQLTQPFEVDATGLQPLSLEDYDLAITGRRRPTDTYYPSTGPYVPPLSNPCPLPASYTDVLSGEAASETATSQVDVDPWQGVTTLQPLRWYRAVVQEHVAPTLPRLEFGARDAAGAAIDCDIQVASDEPAAFESNGGRLTLSEPHEPDTRPTKWSGSAMNVSVSLDGPTRLRVQFSNIVLEKDRLIDEPRVTRTLDSASIVGEWIQQ